MSPGWAARLAASACPLLGIAAWSGTGKTTLLEQLLPALRERGLRVAVIKHAHHAFDVDTPGKDSHRLRSAGATPMLVASAQRFALMMETPDQQEADLEQLVAQLDGLAVDLILVEGFKQWPLPKLELHRAAVGKPLRALHDPWIRALAVPGGIDASSESSAARWQGTPGRGAPWLRGRHCASRPVRPCRRGLTVWSCRSSSTIARRDCRAGRD
ncbi:molybdopterin-guanine dinucleotide biosynthesis protein B [Cobetia sp. ICG0124]|nr:molybdopterin-guanine dinucleotide biosynthesis protein B [Cobetia sp. ICG0124]